MLLDEKKYQPQINKKLHTKKTYIHTSHSSDCARGKGQTSLYVTIAAHWIIILQVVGAIIPLSAAYRKRDYTAIVYMTTVKL